MKADEWRARIAEYGRTLRKPPQGDFETADVIPLQGQEGSAWSVWYRLWTVEEGKSDLAVELTVYVQSLHERSAEPGAESCQT